MPKSRQYIFEWGIVSAIVGSSICAILSPAFLAPLVMVFAVFVSVVGFRTFEPNWVRFIGLGFAVCLLTWACISIIWSIDVDLSIKRSFRLFLMILMGTLAIVFLPRITFSHRARNSVVFFAWAIPAIIIIDTIVGSPIGHALMNGGDPFDRSGPILVLLLWPICILAYRSFGKTGLAATIAGTALMVGLLDNKAALLALGVGTIGAGMAYLRPQLTGLLTSICVLFFVVVVPVGFGLFNEDLRTTTRDTQVEASVRHRLFVWSFSAAKAFEEPLIGWGMGTSRSVPGGEEVKEFLRRDGTIEGQGQAIPLHPHNSFIQIFLELGLIGSILTLFSIILLLRPLIKDATHEGIAGPIAGFVLSILVISSISFGAWQGWWVSIQLLVGALLYGLCKQSIPNARE